MGHGSCEALANCFRQDRIGQYNLIEIASVLGWILYDPLTNGQQTVSSDPCRVDGLSDMAPVNDLTVHLEIQVSNVLAFSQANGWFFHRHSAPP